MKEENMPYQLIVKSFSAECSEEENKKLQDWINSSPDNKEELKQFEKIWKETDRKEYKPNVEAALNKVSGKLVERENTRVPSLRQLLKIASILIFGFGFFGIMYSVKKSGLGNILIVSADNSQRKIALPDGSIVTLNLGSTLKYPQKFGRTERKVEFEGEAYFMIAKNLDKPFVIESVNTITRVLGTEFSLIANVKDSIVKVIVTEGLVSFNLKGSDHSKKILVEAGQLGEAKLKKNIITRSSIEDPNFLAWKTGKLIFESERFGQVVQKISSFYDQTIVLGKEELDSALFTATFDSLSFDEAILAIELIMDVDIKEMDSVLVVH